MGRFRHASPCCRSRDGSDRSLQSDDERNATAHRALRGLFLRVQLSEFYPTVSSSRETGASSWSFGLSDSPHALDLLTLAWSSFRQIRNCSCKIGVVDQLETAIAAALTGFGVGSVFRVRDKRLSCFRRWKLQKCNKRGIQRLAFQRLHISAA